MSEVQQPAPAKRLTICSPRGLVPRSNTDDKNDGYNPAPKWTIPGYNPDLPSYAQPRNEGADRRMRYSMRERSILEERESRRICRSIKFIRNELAKLLLPQHRDLHGEFETEWLEFFIANGHTFGTMYAWAASNLTSDTKNGVPNHPKDYHPSLMASLTTNRNAHVVVAEDGTETVANAIHAEPRRIWDVCCNRVIPFEWLIYENQRDVFWAISHSWASDMEYTWTFVNDYQWAVPLPKDVTLAQIRQELLRAGCRYCWLDVLCLRQGLPSNPGDPNATRSSNEFPQREPMPEEQIQATLEDWEAKEITIRRVMETFRLRWGAAMRDSARVVDEEWKIDVPTIGVIYRKARYIFFYLNGLGREFDFSKVQVEVDEEAQKESLGSLDPRHWLNRAWTLQECWPEKMILATKVAEEDKVVFIREIIPPLCQRLTEIHLMLYPIPHLGTLLKEMVRRDASNPVDRIGGLFCLLLPNYKNLNIPVDSPVDYGERYQLPIYKKGDTEDIAWRRLIRGMALNSDNTLARYLLFNCPLSSQEGWYPSWNNLLALFTDKAVTGENKVPPEPDERSGFRVQLGSDDGEPRYIQFSTNDIPSSVKIPAGCSGALLATTITDASIWLRCDLSYLGRSFTGKKYRNTSLANVEVHRYQIQCSEPPDERNSFRPPPFLAMIPVANCQKPIPRGVYAVIILDESSETKNWRKEIKDYEQSGFRPGENSAAPPSGFTEYDMPISMRTQQLLRKVETDLMRLPPSPDRAILCQTGFTVSGHQFFVKIATLSVLSQQEWRDCDENYQAYIILSEEQKAERKAANRTMMDVLLELKSELESEQPEKKKKKKKNKKPESPKLDPTVGFHVNPSDEALNFLL